MSAPLHGVNGWGPHRRRAAQAGGVAHAAHGEREQQHPRARPLRLGSAGTALTMTGPGAVAGEPSRSERRAHALHKYKQKRKVCRLRHLGIAVRHLR